MALVSDVLAEYGFRVDPVLDADLEAPDRSYAAVWVAVEEDVVVGSVAVRTLGDGRVAELKRMYLRPSTRGRGLGRALLAEATGWASAHGCASMVLDTSPAMAAAQKLYESVDFQRTGTRTEVGATDERCEVLYELVF